MRASVSPFKSFKSKLVWHETTKTCPRIFYLEIFFLESDFCRITPKCFKPNSKKVLQLSIAIENGVLALETEEQIELTKNKIRFDLWLSDLLEIN